MAKAKKEKSPNIVAYGKTAAEAKSNFEAAIKKAGGCPKDKKPISEPRETKLPAQKKKGDYTMYCTSTTRTVKKKSKKDE